MAMGPAVIILAAGKGTRMMSDVPKVAHKIAGLSMLSHIGRALAPIEPQRVVVVTAPGQEAISDLVPDAVSAEQSEALGTGHAVLSALPRLTDLDDDVPVLIILGDTPLLETSTLLAMAGQMQSADLCVLGFRPADPGHYGRLITTADRRLLRIVEAKEASVDELKINFCNSGLMATKLGALRKFLPGISNANAKGEYYLTDLAGLMHEAGLIVTTAEATAEELMPVNSRLELSQAESAMQNRLRHRAMASGVTMIDPTSVFLSADTKFGRDVEIGPNVFIGPGTEIADGVIIRAFCHIEGAIVSSGAVIGPFARLRPGSKIGVQAHIGNFVETKNAVLGVGVKANHLSYLGDVTIGEGSNIGAGTITCNYDGFNKHRTEIGARAFVGSNTSLVAPVQIGSDTYVGSGSVITRDVPDGALAVERAETRIISGWVARFRARFARKKI
jgi:bifunctional UDP-N-acetylglucosamine pyrophosphorylase/glucosamine-1-phosphate N-acetyltransferase